MFGHHGGGHHGGGHHSGGHHGGGHHGGGHHGGSLHNIVQHGVLGGSHHDKHQYVGYHQTGQVAMSPAVYQQPAQVRSTVIAPQVYGSNQSNPAQYQARQQYQQQQQQQPGYQQQPGQTQYQPGYAGPPPGIDPTLWSWFRAVDQDNSGNISSNELQRALSNNNWSHFNPETCRLMIGMFDKDKSGTIDINEFAALWKYIQDWRGCFDRFDKDRTGTIDQRELNEAFTTFGYRLSPDFCSLCVRIFDSANVNTMKFDDFIQCCVMLKTMTDAFRKYDKNQNGVIDISYAQFMEMALDNTL